MSNLARKIEKRNFEILENTPCFTRKEFNDKCNEIRRNYEQQYTEKVRRVVDTYEESLCSNTILIEKRYCIEMCYELAEQMDLFKEECENRQEKIDAIEMMNDNIHKALDKYNHYKKPDRELNKKIKKLQTIFNLVFEEDNK